MSDPHLHARAMLQPMAQHQQLLATRLPMWPWSQRKLRGPRRSQGWRHWLHVFCYCACDCKHIVLVLSACCCWDTDRAESLAVTVDYGNEAHIAPKCFDTSCASAQCRVCVCACAHVFVCPPLGKHLYV
eukprot:1160122-Pelagomonas_calceolata.AAC.2